MKSVDKFNMPTKYSGKQVTRAGELLLKDNIDITEFESSMDVLSYWRFSYETPLTEAFEILKDITLKVDKTAIFAKRLKRYVSIVNKLKRFEDMKLRTIYDIGGCRAIVPNIRKLNKVVRELRKRPEFKNAAGKIKCKDYILNPKDDGYRSYHLIGKFKDDFGEKKVIEVQIRTKLQHDWATALEIVDLFTGQALKSNQGNKDWKEFFASVSKQFAVMEEIHNFSNLYDDKKFGVYLKELNSNNDAIESCINTQKYSKKLDVVKRFNAFTHSLNIVDGKLEKNSVDGYVLVEVDTKKSSVTTSFYKHEDNNEAEKMYIEAEKRAKESTGLVIALVSTTAVGGIKEAYPNYFADSTDFLKHLLFITNAPVQQSFLSEIFSKLTKGI
jgi:ppGpp synthetase/RelA/SpoT-type nucleotidyltranferase